MHRRSLILVAALAAASALAGCETLPPPPPPPSEAIIVAPYVAAAVGDPIRPDADRKRDTDRKPAETVAFAGVKPGMKVADLIPGGGYFTRILARTVGPKGRVYAYVPDELTKLAKRAPAVAAIVDDPAYKANTRMIIDTLPRFAAPEKLDVVWTTQNYHDMHARFMGEVDVAAVNAAIFRSLKPGGVYLVLDHAAEAGSGLRDVDTLHRIDPAVVRQEVEAAGFIYDGETRILRNPDDNKKLSVFDEKLRGHTDQFIYRFRKPRGSR